jgi:iron complex transport system permease protein
MHKAALLLLAPILLISLTILAISKGSTDLPFLQVLDAIFSRIRMEEQSSPISNIVIDLRLPRALIAIVVGSGLGCVGVLLQTVTRNDLADPFLFGLSSGAAAGAIFVITITGDLLGIWTLPLAAFAGGMIASVIVLMLVSRLGHQGSARLILAGLSISFLFLALSNYLVFAGDQRAAHSVLFWTLGGLGLARWDLLPIASVGLFAVLTFACYQRRSLDALMAGEDTARTLGVNVDQLRNSTFLICAFATATFVSITGVIGFIGLMVPHLARMLIGPLHGGLILTSAFIGAVLLLASDILARVILAPQELPIGIITTSIGAIFILLLLMKTNKNY